MDYENRLLYVTRNLVVYNEYSKDIVKAAKVVRKYFKEKPIEQCNNDLQLFVTAYEDGIKFVDAHKDAYWQRRKGNENDLLTTELQFFKKHSEVSETILKSMIGQIFNWYHER